MFDRSRFSSLITLALATCALTWAFAGSALARPDASQENNAAPAYKVVPGDAGKGITNRPPAYHPFVADTNKTPDPVQVDRVLASVDNSKAKPQPAVNSNDDNTGTIALILAIAAILTALGAVTLTVTRTHKPMLGA